MAEVSSEHFRWEGFPWVRQRNLTLELRILAAIGLLLADAHYVAVVLFILLLGASDVSGTDVLVKSLFGDHPCATIPPHLVGVVAAGGLAILAPAGTSHC